MPERASKELPEAKATRRVGSEASWSGHKPRSLRAQFRSKAFPRAQMLAAFIGLVVFSAFVANALLLQSGTRSGTILDSVDLAALSHRFSVPDLPPIRGSATPSKEGVAPIPLPRKRADDNAAFVNDQIEMLLSNSEIQNLSPRMIIYVQQMLNRLGYGPLSENGSHSPQVRNAISRFEKDRKMLPTGEIDGALVRELGRVSGTPLE